MNWRGAIYSTMTAAIVMVTIALVMHSNISAINQEYYASCTNNISDLKRIWQNTRLVLDKISGEALADYVKDQNIVNSSCDASLISQPSAQSKVEEYMTSALNRMMGKIKGEVGCRIQNLNYNPAAGGTPQAASVSISFTLICEQVVKKGSSNENAFYVSYSKNVNFDKRVETKGSDCIVVAYDSQSNTIDANTWY
ncbi:MAG: hypothetical protein N3F05_00260 [Candidatus Diapherotrites archaeon]|nr:hypothetical protein [Candidatus Diapherotrites archaeon]